MKRKAFTLVEVNFAIGAFAIGLLTIMALFSLAFKEGRQSSEDIQTTAAADAIFSQLVMAASSTNLVWSRFSEIESYPDGADTRGWEVYTRGAGYLPIKDPSSTANGAISGFLSELAQCSSSPAGFPTAIADPSNGDLKYGVLIQHTPGDRIIRFSFRAARISSMLFSAPLYYTEAVFQGDPTK